MYLILVRIRFTFLDDLKYLTVRDDVHLNFLTINYTIKLIHNALMGPVALCFDKLNSRHRLLGSLHGLVGNPGKRNLLIVIRQCNDRPHKDDERQRGQYA